MAWPSVVSRSRVMRLRKEILGPAAINETPVLSTDLTDFANWMKWSLGVFRDVPRKPGVYVLRLAEGRPHQRLKGESDIIYIGCAIKIQDRLKSHLNVRTIERNTAFYLQRIQQEVGPLQVSWRTFE